MEMAGLPYTVMVAENRAQYYEWAQNNEVDVYMDISPDRSTLLNEDSGVFTEPYIQLTMSRVTKKDFRGEIQSSAASKAEKPSIHLFLLILLRLQIRFWVLLTVS